MEPAAPDTHISIFYSNYIVDQTQVSCTNAFCHFAVAVSCPVFPKKQAYKVFAFLYPAIIFSIPTDASS